MSDQQQQGPPVGPMMAPTLEDVLASLLHAVDTCARNSTGSQDVREVQEYGAAALSFAQAHVILHPELVAPQGVVPGKIAATVPKPDATQTLPQPAPKKA